MPWQGPFGVRQLGARPQVGVGPGAAPVLETALKTNCPN